MKFYILLALAATIGKAQGGSQRHPLEDVKSWDLHGRRTLLEDNPIPGDGEDEEDTPYTIKHKKPKKHIPFAGGETTHGMMIDAGSVSVKIF